MSEHRYKVLKAVDARDVVVRDATGSPAISSAKVAELAIERKVVAVGAETAFDIDAVLQTLDSIGSDMVTHIQQKMSLGAKPRDAFTDAERQHSVRWYEALGAVPVCIQEDHGFWLYLTLGPLGPALQAGGYVEARKPVNVSTTEEESEADVSPGVTQRHLGAAKRQDTLAHRMHVVGRLSRHLSRPNAPLATTKSSNFHEMYSSHILGGSIRTQPGMQAALVEALANKPQTEARGVVSGSVSPVRAVVVGELLSADAARETLSQIVE